MRIALRIAIDVTPIRADGANGGAKPFVLDLIEGLAARRSHTYTLLTTAKNHDVFERFEASGVARWCVDGLSAPLGLHSAGVDLLYCPMTAPTFAEAGIPTVCTLYDLQHLDHPWFFSSEELAHRAHFYRHLVERADHVVCISEFSRRSVLQHLPIPADRTSAVHIAIHRRLHEQPSEAAWGHLSSLGLVPCRFAFYPANFWPHKNHKMLLVAFARFLRDQPTSELHLVLTGEELGEGTSVRAAITAMGLTGRVHLLGYVSDTQMAALWTVSEFLIFPSLYEGFGIPVLEALRFGKPVLCSRDGSLPEVGGDDVAYLDARDPQTMADALRHAVDDPNALRRMAVAGQVRLAAADPMASADAYLAVFERIAAAQPRNPRSLTNEITRRVQPIRRVLIERRRGTATSLMRTGRAAWRQGHRLRGVARLTAGVVMAPDVPATRVIGPSVARLLTRARVHPLVRRWVVPPETRPWLKMSSLHADGWAGPTLTMDLEVADGDTHIVLSAATPPGQPGRPLRIRLSLDGMSLGVHDVGVGPAQAFQATWQLGRVSAGRHGVTLVASAYTIPNDVLVNGDFRPLTYRVYKLRAESRDGPEGRVALSTNDT